MKRAFLLPILFLLGGCWLGSPEKPLQESGYEERVGIPRTNRQLERKVLVLVQFRTLECSEEIDLLKKVLDKEKIRVKIIRVPDRDALSAMVRSGRADLMAGAFTYAEISAFHLLPVLSYTGTDGKTQYCFAVRHNDLILEQLLGKAEPPAAREERKNTHD